MDFIYLFNFILQLTYLYKSQGFISIENIFLDSDKEVQLTACQKKIIRPYP